MKLLVPLSAILLFVLDSCIQPFNINVDTQNALVVDGLITDQPGPYTVKIAKTRALEDQLGEVDWVQGATVSILDEQGNGAKLREVAAGNYQTDSVFLGVVGKAYHLRFMTHDGDVYESNPEKLLPVGDIDSLYFDMIQKDFDSYLNPFQTVNGFSVHLDGKVLPEQEGFVRWRWTGTFFIRAYPEANVIVTLTPDGHLVNVPAPVPCSGFVYTRGVVRYVFPCTCCYCWVTQYSDKVLVSDGQFVINNTITHQDIAFIPASRRTLYGHKYYLQVEQMSVSRESYEFWKKVGVQQNSGSNLFQTPPAPASGNIQMISGKLPAYGVFSASAVKTKTLIFTSEEVPYTLLPIDTIFDSCIKEYPYSTTKKPPFW